MNEITAIMTMLNRIEEFDECLSNSFEEYIERLEFFFHANDIEDDAKKLFRAA